jgi:hypothetical protein
MIVQTTNTGGDLGSNQFDIAMPGSGVGLFNACTDEWNAPSSGWGAQYGGISSNTCSTFPKALQAGCGFRFDWFEGADNPEVEFERVECPAEIVAKSGCKRDDDGAQKAVEAPVASKAPVTSSSSVAAQEATVASSSVEAASSAYSTSESAPIATSSEAAASSAEAYTTSTLESSAATYTSAAAMASSLSSSSSAATTSSAITPSSSATSSEDAACNVQYVYEYDL